MPPMKDRIVITNPAIGASPRCCAAPSGRGAPSCPTLRRVFGRVDMFASSFNAHAHGPGPDRSSLTLRRAHPSGQAHQHGQASVHAVPRTGANHSGHHTCVWRLCAPAEPPREPNQTGTQRVWVGLTVVHGVQYRKHPHILVLYYPTLAHSSRATTRLHAVSTVRRSVWGSARMLCYVMLCTSPL
jgi:hypothetical protein